MPTSIAATRLPHPAGRTAHELIIDDGQHGVLDLERVRAAWKGHILRLLHVAASRPTGCVDAAAVIFAVIPYLAGAGRAVPGGS